MVKTNTAVAHPKVKSRPISDADVPAVIDILTHGYQSDRRHKFWDGVLEVLGTRRVPAGYSRYGYLLESDGRPVGVLLQIYSTMWVGDTLKPRCNASSWYVDPEYRSFAPLFVSQAFKDRSVTVLNVTPAPHTRTIAKLQGYVQYCDGMFLAVPLLTRMPKDTPVRVNDGSMRPDVPFDEHDFDVLRDHAGYGCIALWCVTPERAFPFVFRRRTLKHIFACAQLMYCRDMADVVRFSGPIGRYLARRGYLFVMADANGPIEGLVGRYFPGKMPRYYWGPDRPRLGDLAYTETAIFGI
jgi:hypothetical protein